MATELQWAPIPGFPGYEVSSVGDVRSHLRDPARVLSPFLSHGYLRVTLTRRTSSGQRKHKRAVHTLVALAFLDPFPEEGLEVAHLNGDQTDNAVENLRWVTHQENCAHKEGHGTLLRGEAHPRAKLSQEDRRDIAQAREQRTATIVELAERYGVARVTIVRVHQAEMAAAQLERDRLEYDLPL